MQRFWYHQQFWRIVFKDWPSVSQFAVFSGFAVFNGSWRSDDFCVRKSGFNYVQTEVEIPVGMAYVNCSQFFSGGFNLFHQLFGIIVLELGIN